MVFGWLVGIAVSLALELDAFPYETQADKERTDR